MEVYKINENNSFNKMTQNMIQNVQSFGLNIDDFYSQVQSFLISIQEIEINDEILGKIIPLFEQLQKMVEDHIDISILPISLLTFLFDIPNQVISQSSMQDINLEDQSFQLQLHFIISFLDFLHSFLCNSSNNICYELRESNYVSTLINILNQSKISLVLYKTILCFISLFDSKPQLGSTIPHDIYSHLYNCYLDINEINKDLKSLYPPRNIFYMENPTMSPEMQKLTLNCSTIEALTNFEIHLLSLYRLVVQENPNRSPAQLEAMLSRLLDSIDKNSIELGDIQTYKIKFVFNMYERIFSSADPIIIKSYMNSSFIETITSFFNGPSELELDKNILICLTKIASLGETSGYMILKSNFVSYRPNFTNDKSLILLYCNTWYTIISNMKNKKPSRLLFAINKGYEALKQCSETIIEMTQSILDAYKNDLDFELIKATTLIHIVLINLNDTELIKLILDRLPDICQRIRDLIEAADSDNINQIVKSIDILFTLNESQGIEYPAFNDFFTLDLVESIDDIIQNITDVDFDFDSIRIVLDKIRSKDTQF
mgnify:CR=1 FL=1